MIIVIRGHLRNSFETKDLYNFIKDLHSRLDDYISSIYLQNQDLEKELLKNKY